VTSRSLPAALLVLFLLTAACVAEQPVRTTPPPSPSTSRTGEPQPPAPDPAAIAANELGDVPVLMYHRIVPEPGGVYDRTPADFRAELVRLAEENYVPVTAAQYTAGDLDVPAGAHPVVLTFDDGDPSQFALTPAGAPVPDTAVAILLDVAESYPDFTPVASFYVNADPFGDPGGTRTLPWLVANGMEVGNHTLTHENLGTLTAAAAQEEIAGGDQAIRAAAPGTTPVTLALPFGVHPDDRQIALRGSAGGFSYEYTGTLLVGADPAPSPFAAEFDPLRIPRIRSQGTEGEEAEFGSTSWLDQLAAAPERRYTSDGVADRISYPLGTARAPAARFHARTFAY